MPHRTELRFSLLACLLVITPLAQPSATVADEYRVSWNDNVNRVWIGPEFWANPMEDWSLGNGHLQCEFTGKDRNIHLLTHELASEEGEFLMQVDVGSVAPDGETIPTYVGFRVAAQTEIDDYRARALKGKGIDAGITTDGQVFIGKVPEMKPGRLADTRLQLTAVPQDDRYLLTLIATEPESGEERGRATMKVAADRLWGSIALVASGNATRKDNSPPTKNMPVWFDSLRVSGSKVKYQKGRTFGPVLWTQYTLSRQRLRLSAMFGPLGENESKTATLEARPWSKEDGKDNKLPFKPVAEAGIDQLARTAIFDVESWDDTQTWQYRVAYDFTNARGEVVKTYFYGSIRLDPVNKPLVVAGFTGNTDSGFPNNEIVRNVTFHNPDMLFFSGDQIYENVGGYGILRTVSHEPEAIARSVTNFIRKQALFGWAFRDVLRGRPSVSLPDDHDVYQGNIWGNGGNPTTMAQHASGGFNMHPDFVNSVFRISCGHLPDAFDTTPMKQGINVFYTDLVYGRVSFAIIEDRYFKSGPGGVLPAKQGRPDHYPTLDDIDPSVLDVPEAKLLGDRQLKFLRHWANDWRGTDLKAVLSATIFANLANYHGGNKMYLQADLDSNGWPQTGRCKALDEIRRGYGFMYAGDQHLASIVTHGIDDWNDAGVSFCVPSIAAGYPRSWLPDKEGRPVVNREHAELLNTGEYKDGLNNLITVHAIGNPELENRKPVIEKLHDKASGYGIVRFKQRPRVMKVECYRLLIDPTDDNADNQFPGWPKTFHQRNMYGRKAAGWLPRLKITGMEDPVLQVINEQTNEIEYTLRIQGTEHQPKVFAKGNYTIRIGDQDADNMKTLKGISTVTSPNEEVVKIDF